MICIICNGELNGNQKKYCSNSCKQKAHWNHKRNTNTYHSQTIRSLSRKMRYIEMLGGCCSNCGYKKNISALEFNHINPSEKLIRLDSRKLSNTREDILLEELSKCELLCANCHREHHYPEMDMNNVISILK